MREDVDPFTLEPPHSEYLENSRLDKDACLAKRRGDTQLGELGAQTGDPIIFTAQGNTLVTISDNTIHRYSGESAAWTETDLAHPLHGAERKVATAASRGANLFSMVLTPTGYVVVYELRKTGETSGNDNVQIAVEGYGKDGEQLWRDEFFGINPQIHQTHLSGAIRDEVLVSYAAYQQPDFPAFTFPVGVLYTKIYNSETGATVGSPVLHDSSVALYNPYQLNHLFTDLVGFLNANQLFTKVGHSTNSWQSAQIKSHMNKTQEKGIVANIKAVANHALGSDVGVIQEVDEDGVSTAVNWVFETGSTEHAVLIDAKLDDAGWAHVLWATRSSTNSITGQTILKYAVRNLSVGTTWSTNIISTGDFTVTSGSIGVRSESEPAYLAYRIDLGNTTGPSPENTLPAFDESYLEIRGITSWTGGIVLTAAAKLRNHTLASGIEIEPNTDKAYACIEQYNDYTPHVELGNTEGGEADIPSMAKQVTTILCEISENQDQPAIPVATLDAGTSKHLDAVRSMQCNHLNSLYFDDDDNDALFYINRNLYSPEDHTMYASGTWTGVGGNIVLGHNNFSLALGNARGTLYRINNDYQFSSTTFGDGLVVNSALPLWIDEGSVSEATVLDQPEIAVLFSSDLAKADKWCYNELGGDKYHTLQAVIGYTDHSGNVHRSSPSEVLYIDGIDESDCTNPGEGGLTVKVTPPIVLNVEQPYFCEIYSSPAGENPRLTTQVTFLPKDVFEDGIEISWQHIMYRQNNVSNILRSTKDVYTTGGEFASDPWAPFGASVVTSRRMFALSTSLVGTVFYTKLFQENVAPEFSASNVLSLGDARKLKAIGTIDDKVLVFEKDAVHVIFGDGPSNTGRGAPFSVQRLQTDIGCEDPESVVEIPQGLMFYSSVSSEFHLIDRELQLHNIGAPVRGLSEKLDVKSATVVPEEREVRFLVTDTSSAEAFGPDPAVAIGSLERPPRPRFRHVLPTDPVVVYNYERDAWWVNSNMRGESSTLFQNKYTRIDSTFDVFQESSTSWQSQTGDNLMKVTTPWFKFDGLQGYARVRRAWVLGRYMSDFSDSNGIQAGDLQVTARYNNEGEGSTTTKLYRANIELQPDAERFQLRFTPGRQKVQSIQFDLEELETALVNVDDPTFSIGRGFEITGIDLEVVLKGGGIKTLSARRKK